MKHKDNTSMSVVARTGKDCMSVSSLPAESRNPVIGCHSFIQNIFIEPRLLFKAEDATVNKTELLPS